MVEGRAAGHSHFIESGELVLGADPRAGFLLEDPGVSRLHAKIVASNGQFLLRDLASTNGTTLNGSRIVEAYLAPGDVIGVGTCRLVFEPSVEVTRIAPSAGRRFGPIFGTSLAMRQLFGILERVARTDTTVLILGAHGICAALSPGGRSSHLPTPTSGVFTTYLCHTLSLTNGVLLQ